VIVRTLCVFLAALAPRLYAALAYAREPVWDGHFYDIGARSIAQGIGYASPTGSPWCHYPVGYSGLLGLTYRIAGDGQFTAPVVNAVAGALLAAAVYRLARHTTTESRALAAGLLVAVYPGLVLYAALLMTEPVAALALCAAALAAAWARPRPWQRALLAGVLLGLGTLVRPQSILCAPAIGLFLPAGQRLRAALVATGVAIAVVAPWTARNCLVMDGCAFVSTNGGWNLAIGSFPRATGRFETLHGSDGCAEVTGQVDQDRCWVRAGARFIADDPGRWLALAPKKLGYTFDHEAFPIGYVAEADPDAWPEERRALGRAILSWSHRALLTAAVLGLLPRPSRRRGLSFLPPFVVLLYAWYAAMSPTYPFWPLAVAIPILAAVRHRVLPAAVLYAAVAVGTLALTHVAFFGEDRYHFVVTPLLCLLAARAFAGDGLTVGPRAAI
jgi:dolichyl-phosphate-mannose-protein mannosyltransferase